MTSRRSMILALSLSLVACQSPPGKPVGVTPRPNSGGNGPAANPDGGASSSMATLALKPHQLLQPLKAPSVTLKGQVRLDGDYASRRGGGNLVGNAGGTLVGNAGGTLVGNAGGTLVVLGGGRLVGNAGGTLVGNAGGTLVGNAGGTLVGNAGGTLVGNAGGTLVGNAGGTLLVDRGGQVLASGGGNVVVPPELVGAGGSLLLGLDGAALVGNAGGTLVGNAGGTLVGNAGGTLVGNAGGTLVGNAGGTYRALLQAAGATPVAAFGEEMPAAGMWLSAVDVRTGFTVPLGLDAAGQEVHTVYTNLQGAFELQVPEASAKHLRLVARAPNSLDRRMVLTTLPAAEGDSTVDDDQTAVMAFLKGTAKARLFSTFSVGPRGTGEVAPLSAEAQALLKTYGLEEANAAVEALKPVLSDRALEELSSRVGDAYLADLDLSALRFSQDTRQVRHPASKELAGQPALVELVAVLRRLREAAKAKVVAAGAEKDPAAYFAQKPYVAAANLRRKPSEAFRLERPADLADFLVQEYYSGREKVKRDQAALLFEDLGMSVVDLDRLDLATSGLAEALFVSASAALGTNESLGSRVLKVVQQEGERLKSLRFQDPPAVAPLPLPQAPLWGPERQVQSVAGLLGDNQPPTLAPGEEKAALGAPIGGPLSLALDASQQPPVLYMSTLGLGKILRFRFDAAGVASLSVLPGQGPQLEGHLLHDGQGHLYVASEKSQSITRVFTSAERLGQSQKIAGSGGAGFLDGPGEQAQFNSPRGMAIDPQSGDLFVADFQNRRIRRIALKDPAFAVSTFLGNGLAARVEGSLLPDPGLPLGGSLAQLRNVGAAVAQPNDLAFDAKGSLYFTDSDGQVRRVEKPFQAGARSQFVAGGGAHTDLDSYHAGGALAPQITAFTLDPQGNVVVVQRDLHRLRLVSPEGWVHTLAGGGLTFGPGGHAEGLARQARFAKPMDVVAAPDGTLYVADQGNALVRRILP